MRKYRDGEKIDDEIRVLQHKCIKYCWRITGKQNIKKIHTHRCHDIKTEYKKKDYGRT
jgi:hypothetical protein